MAFNPTILRQTNDGYELIKVQSITNSKPKDKFKPCPKACSACASACMACRTLVISRTLTWKIHDSKRLVKLSKIWEIVVKDLLSKCCKATFNFQLQFDFDLPGSSVHSRETTHTRPWRVEQTQVLIQR